MSCLRMHSPKGEKLASTVVAEEHLWVGTGYISPEAVGQGLRVSGKQAIYLGWHRAVPSPPCQGPLCPPGMMRTPPHLVATAPGPPSNSEEGPLSPWASPLHPYQGLPLPGRESVGRCPRVVELAALERPGPDFHQGQPEGNSAEARGLVLLPHEVLGGDRSTGACRQPQQRTTD